MPRAACLPASEVGILTPARRCSPQVRRPNSFGPERHSSQRLAGSVALARHHQRFGALFGILHWAILPSTAACPPTPSTPRFSYPGNRLAKSLIRAIITCTDILDRSRDTDWPTRSVPFLSRAPPTAVTCTRPPVTSQSPECRFGSRLSTLTALSRRSTATPFDPFWRILALRSTLYHYHSNKTGLMPLATGPIRIP